jgi:predicted GNAT family N-acyltransferase
MILQLLPLCPRERLLRIKQIGAEDTLPIRNKVLREGRPLSECKFEGDESDQTFHLGAFVDKKLVSVASFYYNPNPKFEFANQYQLRGMATLETYRQQGFSTELLKVAFPMIKQNFCDLVWCNARVQALDFYEKLGFNKASDVFDIPGVGPHVLMYKELS